MDFEVNREYSRRNDIHKNFGGQQQGGISTPTSHPYVFLFTGISGAAYGYQDGWIDDTCFAYTGEGQVGDMEFERGNRAIRDHLRNRKSLLLFETQGKGKSVVFRGQFSCHSWEYFQGLDANENERRSIRFHLIRSRSDLAEASEARPTGSVRTSASFVELRLKALALPAVPPEADPQLASRNYYERSNLVRDYVLARANGRCELTGRPAPFLRKDGSPYLEVHHTHMLSDDGPDHPLYVGAIHPTIHREIHHGMDGQQLNNDLIAKLAEIENALASEVGEGIG